MIEITAFQYQYPTTQGEKSPLILTFPAFTAAPSELIWLAGYSGCGKTNLLNLVAGLMPAPPNCIYFDNSDLSLLTPSQRDAWRAKTVGLVPQEPLLIDCLTALQNVTLPLQHSGDGQLTAVKRLFSDLNLSRVSHHKPTQLSRGQQQRVALARAFANHPALVLADEPTANLDDIQAHTVMTQFTKLLAREGTSAVIASHDARIASYCSRKVVFA